MKAILMFLLLASPVFADEASEREAAYKRQPQMSSDFLGEPKTIGDMRIGDYFMVPAHALSVDKHAKCWLDPKCKLNEKSDHLIRVGRYKEKISITNDFHYKDFVNNKTTIIGYSVYIDKKLLQGWRWKLLNVDKTNRIPVQKLSYSFSR